MKQRVTMRELGISKGEYVFRAVELDAILDRARLEDFSVINDKRSVTEVALEMLIGSRWIPAQR